MNPKKEIPTIKRFNKDIEISISIDSIADKFMATLDPEHKHNVELTNTVMGVFVEKGKITYLYNALNGFTNDIDFKVDEEIHCTDKAWGYKQVTKPDGALVWEQHQLEIGKATIKTIDLYSNQKLYVEFTMLNKLGEPKPESQWVNHRNCNHWAELHPNE